MRSASRAVEIRSSSGMVGDDAACLEAGQRGLGHSGSGGEFDLGQSERQTAGADDLADQVGALGFGVAFAVFVVSRRWLASCS